MKTRFQFHSIGFATHLLVLMTLGCQGAQTPSTLPPMFTLAPSPTYPQIPIPTETPDLSATHVTVVPAETASGAVTLDPNELATQIQGYKDEADITLDDNGQVFTYTLASRFFVFLDDQAYPVSSLDCKPEWIMGLVSNGLFRGARHYPQYYETVREGSCTLVNGDFAAQIVVIGGVPSTLTP